MTATDELRALLDERGVEWGNIRNDDSESDYLTEWQFENNQGKATAIEWSVGSGLSVDIYHHNITPAHAIAATLGRGTCKRIWTGSEMICSECAHQLNDPTANFCPTCGREVMW